MHSWIWTPMINEVVLPNINKRNKTGRGTDIFQYKQ